MPEEKQHSTTCKGGALATRASIAHSPIALRMYERMADGTQPMNTAMLAVIASSDRSIATAADSVRSAGQVSVKRFAKDFDARSLSAVILSHLTFVEDMCNVARPMKPDAMAALAKQVAQMLLDDDMTWNLADIQIVADRLVNGEAGQVYGGLNTQTVMKAFTEYMCEKCDAFVELREEEAREHRLDGFGERQRGRSETEQLKNIKAMAMYASGDYKNDIKQ